MKINTVYGLNCPVADEAAVVARVNKSLARIHRTTSKATHKSLLDAMKPFVHKHYYWNLNRGCGVSFEIIRNEDLKGQFHCPARTECGLLLEFYLHDQAFRNGAPMKKSLKYVERILGCLDVPYELIADGDHREAVEFSMQKKP